MKVNCLLIDDEPLALRVLENHIEKIPWLNVVNTCTNPLEGLEELKKHRVDLLFLDIQMPELSGLDFMDSLSSSPAAPMIARSTFAWAWAVAQRSIYRLDWPDWVNFWTISVANMLALAGIVCPGILAPLR